MYAPDGTSRTWSRGSGAQAGASVGVIGATGEAGQGGGSRLGYRNRFTYRKGKTSSTTDATATQVNRVSAEDDGMFRFRADISHVLRLKREMRNAVANLFGYGPVEDVQIVVRVPRAAQFVLTGQ